MRFTKLTRTLCASALVALLAACGGGGNSGNSPFPDATPPTADGGHVPIFALSTASLVLSTTTGTPTAQTFTVSEAGYGGVFNGVIACTSNPPGQTGATNQFVAEFSSGLLTDSETPAAPGSPATFSVDPGAWTGSCTVTITDADNNTTTVAITVSATNVVVYGKQRR